MRKILNFIIILTLFLLAFFYIKNMFMIEEAKVKRVISKGERAVERKDIIRCAFFVSPDYLDSFGNDNRSLIYLADKIFREHEDIFIHIESLNIEIKNDFAEVKFVAKIVLTRGEKERKLSVEKGSERFKLTFRKEESKWKLFRANIPEYRFD